MEWVETTAATVEDAKERALDELGVDEQDAEFEVVEEPRPGLFGRLRGEARVRARVRPRTPPPKVDRRERRRRRRGAEAPGAPAPQDSSAPEQEAPRPARQSKRGSSPRSKPAASAAGRTSERAPRGAAKERGMKRASQAAPKGRPTDERSSEEDLVNEDAMTEEDQAARAGEFLEGLADAFELSGSISTERVTDELIEVRLEGDDLGWMIGPKGGTLQAIYDLAKAVVQREADGQRSGRFRIDIGGYRARRREALVRFAQQVAQEVADSGEPRSLEPMGASDRKTVHDTVNDVAGAQTRSEGEEPRRRVVIEPDEG